MLQPESSTCWPQGVPFPLNVRLCDYGAEVHMETDDDSALARQFRYVSRFPQFTTMAEQFGLLYIASTIGDLEFLDQMQHRFGGVLYSTTCALAALSNRHFDFYIYFMHLSRSCCILQCVNCETPLWASARFQPLLDVLEASLCQELRSKIFQYVYENITLTDPSHEYLKMFLHSPIRDVSGGDEEYDLVSSAPGYPNLTSLELSIILDSVLKDFSRSHLVGKYLLEDQGYYFSLRHLEEVVYHKRLYEFVLHNLEPGVSRDDAELDQPYCLLDDFDLVSTVLIYFDPDRIGSQDDFESELKNMAELFFDQPNLIPKIVYLTFSKMCTHQGTGAPSFEMFSSGSLSN